MIHLTATAVKNVGGLVLATRSDALTSLGTGGQIIAVPHGATAATMACVGGSASKGKAACVAGISEADVVTGVLGGGGDIALEGGGSTGRSRSTLLKLGL